MNEKLVDSYTLTRLQQWYTRTRGYPETGGLVGAAMNELLIRGDDLTQHQAEMLLAELMIVWRRHNLVPGVVMSRA